MINEFIDKTIKILKLSDIRIHMPDYRDVKLEGSKKIVGLSFAESFSRAICLQENLIFHVMIFFTLLDTFIDLKYVDLEGQGFAKKCNELPVTNDTEKIIKNIYRILRIFRNASIHSKNTIKVLGDRIIINDNYKNNTINLEISKLGLELIYTIILYLIDEPPYTASYRNGIMRFFQDRIYSEIVIICDNFGTDNLERISSNLKLKASVRYNCINPTVIFDEPQKKIIIEKYKFHEEEYKFYSCDYNIIYEKNKYLIPHEALDDDGSIYIDKIQEWKI